MNSLLWKNKLFQAINFSKRFPDLMLLAAASLSCLPTAQAVAWSKCWQPYQLSYINGEERVQRGLASAHVSPPADDFSPRGPRSRFGPLVIRRVILPRSAGKLVALTFDIGEQPDEKAGYQGKIIDSLRRHKIPSTLFLGGKWMLTHRTRTQQLIADPLFEIGNHSWGHRNYRVLNKVGRLRSTMRTQDAYKIVLRQLKKQPCWRDPAKDGLHWASPLQELRLFRYPFGACNKFAQREIWEAGLTAVQWDVSSGDPSKSQTALKMANHVVRSVRPGSIVLFHANGRGWHTDEAVPIVIRQLKRAGYKFRTVTQLLKTKGARPELTSSCYDQREGDVNRYDELGKSLVRRYQLFLHRYGSSKPKLIAPPQLLKN